MIGAKREAPSWHPGRRHRHGTWRRRARRPLVRPFVPFHRPTPVRDLNPAVAPFAHGHGAPRRGRPALALELQRAIVVPDDPVLPDDAGFLEMKDLIELTRRRAAAVHVFGRRRGPREATIVFGPVRLGEKGI